MICYWVIMPEYRNIMVLPTRTYAVTNHSYRPVIVLHQVTSSSPLKGDVIILNGLTHIMLGTDITLSGNQAQRRNATSITITLTKCPSNYTLHGSVLVCERRAVNFSLLRQLYILASSPSAEDAWGHLVRPDWWFWIGRAAVSVA